MSVTPAGGNGTMILTGLLGYCWAKAELEITSSAPRATMLLHLLISGPSECRQMVLRRSSRSHPTSRFRPSARLWCSMRFHLDVGGFDDRSQDVSISANYSAFTLAALMIGVQRAISLV